MAEETHIDVEGVQRVANNVVAAAQEFSAGLDELKAQLATHEGCWGDDKIGSSFAKNYVPNAGEILDGATKLAKGAEDGTQVLQQTPGQFQLQDSHNGNGANH